MESGLHKAPFPLYTFESKFVGRKAELRKLNAAWKKNSVFGVFGIRSIGKSRLISEFLSQKRIPIGLPDDSGQVSDFFIEVYKSDLRRYTDINSVYVNLCASLFIKPEPEATLTERWIGHMVEALNRKTKQSKSTVVLFFDNVENLIESEDADPFLRFIVALIRRCPEVKTFLTSTTRIQFAQDGRVFYSHNLSALTPTESFELLKATAPSVELNEYKDAILKLSEGLPLLILMIGAELNEGASHMTPQKMVETLSKCRLQTCSKQDYSKDDLTQDVGDVYKNFILRLTQVYQERLKVLEFIPGSFDATESMDMLGYETVSMVKGDVLVHLHRRFMITYDPFTQRFDIQGILRESLQMYFTLSNISEVRSKYCKTFYRVITNITTRLGTAECSKALKDFAIEQANLQKFLKEVLYTKEDTYPFYLEVASSCAILIENFMEGESEVFYNGCLRAAEAYGRPGDKAIIHVSIGSLYTNIKEDLLRGANYLRSAIESFAQNDQTRKIHLATAYQRLGWNLHKQGKNLEAVRFLEKSYAITSKLGIDAIALRVQNMNSLGLVNDMLGNFGASEEYHFKSLHTRRSKLGKDHPSIGPTLNNIGTFFKKKGNYDEARKYFLESLEEKLKHEKKLPVLSIVDSMCNTAEEFIRLGDYDRANSYLKDVDKLLMRQEVPSKEGLAMMYLIRGRAFAGQNRFREASECFQQSIAIRQEAFPEDIGHFECIVDKAVVEFRSGNLDNALDLIRDAKKMKNHVFQTMPYTLHYLKCLECMADVYKCKAEDDSYQKTLWKMESELLRLEKVHVSLENEQNMVLIKNALSHVRELIGKLFPE